MLMNITESIALFLSCLYIVGMVIYNLRLYTYGFREYRLARAVYIVVGVQFLLSAIFPIIVGAFIGIVLSMMDPIISIYISLVLFAISCLSLMFFSARPRAIKSVWIIFVWTLAGALSFSLPFLLLFIRARKYEFGLSPPVWYIIAFSCSIFFVLIPFYSKRLLIMESRFNYIFLPLNSGARMMVRLAFNNDDIEMLTKIGIPMSDSTQSLPVELLDETDQYLIVIVKDHGLENAIKISKDVVKAVRFEKFSSANNHA